MKKIETQMYAAVGTASQQHVLCMQTLLYPAVGTKRDQYGSAACTVCG